MLMFPITDILRDVAGLMHEWADEDRITYRSLHGHRKHHMNVEDAAYVEAMLQEQEKALAGANGHMRRVLTAMMVIRKAIEDGFHDQVDGVLRPRSIGDMIALMRLQDELKSKTSENQTVLATMTKFALWAEAMRRTIPREMFERFQKTVAELERKPMQVTGSKRDDDRLDDEVEDWE